MSWEKIYGAMKRQGQLASAGYGAHRSQRERVMDTVCNLLWFAFSAAVILSIIMSIIDGSFMSNGEWNSAIALAEFVAKLAGFFGVTVAGEALYLVAFSIVREKVIANRRKEAARRARETKRDKLYGEYTLMLHRYSDAA